jgi:septin family protein
MGKSTFVNTLFAHHLLDSKGRKSSNQISRKTVAIDPVSHGKLYHCFYYTSY